MRCKIGELYLQDDLARMVCFLLPQMNEVGANIRELVTDFRPYTVTLFTNF